MNPSRARPVPGALVISLDFELAWGIRDRPDGGAEYARNLYGARTLVPRLLGLFDEFEISATWATVGFLFARSRTELDQFSPDLTPAYQDESLSPYGEPVGADEEADPLHYAPTLISRIQGTPRQEIATHTYSHYYCGEEGQTFETFRADLAAATEIAEAYGVEFQSIVFPRNQHNPKYDEILKGVGIRAYRGNPRSPFWRFSSAEESKSPWKRAGRLLDTYVGMGSSGTVPWTEVLQPNGLCDVRASCFVAPYRPVLRTLEPLRLARLRRSIRSAARRGRIVHLWWHPHNFGVHQEENLSFLRGVLKEFVECRERYGMRSLSMAEVAHQVQKTFMGESSAGVGSSNHVQGSG